MIRHCVFLNLRADHDALVLQETFAGLEQLCAQLPDTFGFAQGPNKDFEQKSPDFAVGFTIDFTDAAALARYADHPEHKKLGGQLVAQCTGGGDGIVVFDLDVPAKGGNRSW